MTCMSDDMRRAHASANRTCVQYVSASHICTLAYLWDCNPDLISRNACQVEREEYESIWNDGSRRLGDSAYLCPLQLLGAGEGALAVMA
jgi:hypothetical protein